MRTTAALSFKKKEQEDNHYFEENIKRLNENFKHDLFIAIQMELQALKDALELLIRRAQRKQFKKNYLINKINDSETLLTATNEFLNALSTLKAAGRVTDVEQRALKLIPVLVKHRRLDRIQQLTDVVEAETQYVTKQGNPQTKITVNYRAIKPPTNYSLALNILTMLGGAGLMMLGGLLVAGGAIIGFGSGFTIIGALIGGAAIFGGIATLSLGTKIWKRGMKGITLFNATKEVIAAEEESDLYRNENANAGAKFQPNAGEKPKQS